MITGLSNKERLFQIEPVLPEIIGLNQLNKIFNLIMLSIDIILI